MSEAVDTARAYFGAIAQGDRGAQREWYGPDMVGSIHGIVEDAPREELIAWFEVVHLPGHAPGLIALWRAEDRLALCSDAFYTLDFYGRDTAPRLPMAVYNLDTGQARASVRKLAALEPAVAWPGHAEPVRGALEQAAAAA